MVTVCSSMIWKPTLRVDGGCTSLLADDAAASLLDQIGGEFCVPGDPVALDPEECVRERLGEWIERGVIEPEE